jgi:hypothetical protein
MLTVKWRLLDAVHECGRIRDVEDGRKMSITVNWLRTSPRR